MRGEPGLDLLDLRPPALGLGAVAGESYCFGGAVVWVAATEQPEIACAVSYYGSRILSYRCRRGRNPRATV